MSEKYKFRDKDGIYFITATFAGWIDLFTKKEYCEIGIESLIISAQTLLTCHANIFFKTEN